MIDPALALFGAGLAVWMVAEVALTSSDRPVPGTLALPTGILVLAGHVVGVVGHLGHTSPGWAVAAGSGLFAAGCGLRMWAIAALGPAFASALDSARLISSGPYRWSRHPSEAGLLVAMIGGNAMLATRFAWLATAAAVPLAVIRCRREDAALIRRHGQVHAAWAMEVGWLWRR